MHSHIIYYTTYKNTIIYIGCGLPTRYKHTTSGCSHVYDLNRLHFTDPDNVQTTILRGCTSEQEALELEKALIQQFKPIYNTQYLSTQERYSKHKDEIQKYSQEFIPLPSNKELIQTYNLSGADKLKLGNKPLYKDVCLDYAEALLNKDKDVIDTIKSDPDYQELVEFVSIYGVDKLSAVSYQKSKIIAEVTKYTSKSSTVDIKELPFVVDGVYTKADVKTTIQNYYDSKGIKAKAKATDILDWYDVTRTSKQGKEAYKILTTK